MENTSTESELNERGFHFERYGRGTDDGAGCIIAFYKNSDAKFTGRSLDWNRQPIVRDPFASKAEAIAAAQPLTPPR